MANHWGARSLAALEFVHPDLRRLADAVLVKRDCSALSGLRGEEEQNDLFRLGKTKAKYPYSDHNCSLDPEGEFTFEVSDALDLMAYPIEWPDPENDSIAEFCRKSIAIYEFALLVDETARELAIAIKWGGMFRNFFDGPHFSRRTG